MEENNQKPSLRFKGFTEAWEQRKLNELTNIITKGTTPLDKVNEGTINFIKIENIDSFSGNINITSKITEEEHNSYLKRSQLKENDLLFSIAGTLGRVTVVKSDILPANTNQALAIIRLKDGDINYIKTYLKGKTISNFIKRNPTIGAQPNLSLEQVGNFDIDMPNKEEQQKLGNLFNSIDNLITLHQRKCDKLVNVKKALLEKMFPNNGKNVPELRFKGFTEAWEQHKFKDYGSVAMCKRIFKYETSDSGDIPFYKIGTFGDKADAFITNEKYEYYKSKFSFPNKGDILLSASGTIGRIVEYSGEKAYFQDSNIVWLNHNDNIKNSFLKVLYPIVKWDGIEGSTIKRLYNSNFLSTEIHVPKVKEQEKIGVLFEKIDNLITLHQQE